MKYELPKLKFSETSLAPSVSGDTIGFHYGKHLLTYINNLNGLIQGTEFENLPLEEIIKKSEGAVFNNAAQTWNHIFYFDTFSPAGGSSPKGELAAAIEKKWGSFDNFKKEFASAAVSIFGSGWAWLVKNDNRELEIVKESNAGNPLTKGLTPLLTFDVWEHAYYLDYQNRRADHVNALWNIIDWNIVESRY